MLPVWNGEGILEPAHLLEEVLAVVAIRHAGDPVDGPQDGREGEGEQEQALRERGVQPEDEVVDLDRVVGDDAELHQKEAEQGQLHDHQEDIEDGHGGDGLGEKVTSGIGSG